MKKTLKTKLIAGTTAVALFSGAGFAFANTSAGDVFRAWASPKITVTEAGTIGAIALYQGVKTVQATGFYADERKGIKSEIESKRNTEITSKSESLSSKSAEQVASLNSEKDAILNEIDAKFVKIENDGKQLIDSLATQGFNYANADASRYATTIGGQSMTKLQTDLDSARTTATTNLSNAISAAKNDVTTTLANKKFKTSEEMKAYIDDKYNTLTAELSTLIDGYIATQNGLLQAEAERIESQGLTELDAIVSGINN